jgi:hypothetical protein
VFHEVLFSAGALAEGQGENRATVCSVAQGGRASVQLAAGMDPVRELAGTYVREREHDLAGQQAIGGSGSGQPREGGHGASWWRVLWLLPHGWQENRWGLSPPHQLVAQGGQLC